MTKHIHFFTFAKKRRKPHFCGSRLSLLIFSSFILFTLFMIIYSWQQTLHMASLSTALHNGFLHIFYLERFCQMCGHAGCETSFCIFLKCICSHCNDRNCFCICPVLVLQQQKPYVPWTGQMQKQFRSLQ